MTNLIERCGNGGGGAGAAYSTTDGALQVKEVDPARYGDVLEVFDIPVNLAVGTYYYPGDSGLSFFGYPQSASFFFKVSTNEDTTIRLRIVCTNHHTDDDFVDCTPTWTTTGNLSVAEIVVAPDSTDYAIGISKIDPEYYRYALEVVVESTGTSVSTIYASLLRKAK